MIKSFLKSHILLLGFAFIVMLYLPYLFMGESSFVGYSGDFLDSSVVWTKLIKDSGTQFAPNCVIPSPSIMNQPRISLGSELNFIYLLFSIFSAFWAVVINSFLIAVIGYFSLFLFLDYFIRDLKTYYKVIISLCFALLPFWPFGGISTAGFPLVFLILWKVSEREKIDYRHFIFLIFYASYSNFLVFTSFLYFYAVLFFFVKSIWRRKITFQPFIIIGILFLLGLASEYRHILFKFHPCFESNRESAGKIYYENIIHPITYYLNINNYSNMHASPLQFPFLITFLGVAVILLNKNLLKNNVFLASISTIIISGVFSFGIVNYILDILNITYFKGVSLHRFNMVNQIAWYILVASLTHQFVTNKNKIIKFLPAVFIMLQLMLAFLENVPFKNLRSAISPEKFEYNVRYSDYYMIDEYKQIEKILPGNKGNYKLIHYGFQPVGSIYHGYSTVDGFFAFFENTYSERFNAMIAPTISGNPNKYAKTQFTYHKYIPYYRKKYIPFNKESNHIPIDVKIRFDILESFGTTHILSTSPLTNHQFKIIGNVASKYWGEIFIYRIDY